MPVSTCASMRLCASAHAHVFIPPPRPPLAPPPLRPSLPPPATAPSTPFFRLGQSDAYPPCSNARRPSWYRWLSNASVGFHHRPAHVAAVKITYSLSLIWTTTSGTFEGVFSVFNFTSIIDNKNRKILVTIIVNNAMQCCYNFSIKYYVTSYRVVL